MKGSQDHALNGALSTSPEGYCDQAALKKDCIVLQVIIFDRVDLPAAATPLDRGPGNQADELWGALSHLKHLTQLCIDNWEYPNDNEEEYDEDFLEDSRAPFFGKVSLVTQLR